MKCDTTDCDNEADYQVLWTEFPIDVCHDCFKEFENKAHANNQGFTIIKTYLVMRDRK